MNKYVMPEMTKYQHREKHVAWDNALQMAVKCLREKYTQEEIDNMNCLEFVKAMKERPVCWMIGVDFITDVDMMICDMLLNELFGRKMLLPSKTPVSKLLEWSKHEVENIVQCDGCGKGFTEDEWEDRHQPHDKDCVNHDGCDCDFNTHPQCCWECEEYDEYTCQHCGHKGRIKVGDKTVRCGGCQVMLVLVSAPKSCFEHPGE